MNQRILFGRNVGLRILVYGLSNAYPRSVEMHHIVRRCSGSNRVVVIRKLLCFRQSLLAAARATKEVGIFRRLRIHFFRDRLALHCHFMDRPPREIDDFFRMSQGEAGARNIALVSGVGRSGRVAPPDAIG